MPQPNRLEKALSPLSRLPAPLRKSSLSLVLGRAVPFVGTAGLVVEELSPERAVVRVANRRRVQNHIHGVHAAAMALLAETATGFVVGMNVPDDKLLVVKSMKIDFKTRATGGLRAVATLTPDQRELVQRAEKGEVHVAVTVTDEEGKQPVVCELVWAWLPKKKDETKAPG